jgi:flagellar hook-associated protein 3 FlgL
MRISTAQIYGAGISNLQSQQSTLLKTQQQLASGKRVLTPADDPAGAVQALQLHERIASVEQYARNADQAKMRLGQEESVLGAMGDSLHRVRELAVQAANASQTEESRQTIARELRQISAGLLYTANSRDANGEYLFAGYRTATQPFSKGPSGQIEYAGDNGQRRVALAPDSEVTVGDSGTAFMSIPRGNGTFIVTPDAANTGTGRVAGAEVVVPAAYNGESYSIVMVAVDAYEVRDSGGIVVGAGPYLPDQGIDVGGTRVTLTGSPQTGDSFSIEPAGTSSLFSIVDELAAALEAPSGTPAQLAQLNHRAGTALLDIDQALGRVLELRTDVGVRMNRIETQQVVNEDQSLHLETAVSSVEDLDYAEAIGRFKMQEAALQVAQQTYVQVARLSLFDWLR